MKIYAKTYDRLDGANVYRVKMTDQDVTNLYNIVEGVTDCEEALDNVCNYTWSDEAVEGWVEVLLESYGGMGMSEEDLLREIEVLTMNTRLEMHVYVLTDDFELVFTADDDSEIFDYFEDVA